MNRKSSEKRRSTPLPGKTQPKFENMSVPMPDQTQHNLDNRLLTAKKKFGKEAIRRTQIYA